MQLPPDLIHVDITPVNMAAALVNQTDAILAAPGAGMRYRLWTVVIGSRAGGSDLNWDGVVTAAASSANRVSFASRSGQFSYSAPGGVALATNQGIDITWRTAGGAGTTGIRVTIGYTLESI